MKTTRYRFEQAVQEVKQETKDWLRDEFKAILESDKDFTRKADYIGFSIASIDDKVASIDEEIKELQSLKKQLKSAKTIAVAVGAEVFAEYGITKLEGAGISSLTLSKPTTKQSVKLDVKNETALINAGYHKLVLDEQAVLDGFSDEYEREFLQEQCSIVTESVTTPAKLKINKRRASKVEAMEMVA